VIAVDEYPWLRGSREPASETSGVRYADQRAATRYLDLHDLTDWLDRAGTAVKGIVHLGACSDTMVTDRDWVMENNCGYTQRIWAWCTRANCPLIYASSAATYGDGIQGYDDDCDPSIYRPLNFYAESKQTFDVWALRQATTPPRWVGVKYFNVYGPREEHKGRMASVVFHGYHQIRDTGTIQLFQSHREGVPDGGQQRDFIYVEDAVEATLHFLDTPVSVRAPNGLYNIGVGQARTFADLGRAIYRAMRLEPRIQYVPMPPQLRSRYQYHTQARIGKLRQAGYTQPMSSLEDGVQRYVETYLSKEARAA
jgi:ADP-L-glycero-D-manno-heptose 6-epimerase